MNKNVQSKTLEGNITELTAIAPIEPGKVPGLKDTLEKVQKIPSKHSPLKIIQTIHYARWVIIDEEKGNPRLLFTTNFDGSLEDYLGDFSDNDANALNMVFGACVGWPGAQPVGPFIDYVKKHQVPTNLFYAAYPEFTTKEVFRALDWKNKTDEFLADLEGLWGQRISSPIPIVKLAEEFFNNLTKPTVPK